MIMRDLRLLKSFCTHAEVFLALAVLALAGGQARAQNGGFNPAINGSCPPGYICVPAGGNGYQAQGYSYGNGYQWGSTAFAGRIPSVAEHSSFAPVYQRPYSAPNGYDISVHRGRLPRLFPCRDERVVIRIYLNRR
jgi:hypothetical protein